MSKVDAKGTSEPCPISQCADIVCGKWTLLVIRELNSGPKYFRDLEQALPGISPRTLCERLKFLAEHELLSRTYIKALPPRTQYELTNKGEALEPLLVVMRDYGVSWLNGRAPESAAPAARAESAQAASV